MSADEGLHQLNIIMAYPGVGEGLELMGRDG